MYKKCHRRHKAKERCQKYIEQRRFYDQDDDDIKSSIDDDIESDDDDYNESPDDILQPGKYPFDDGESDDSAPDDCAKDCRHIPVSNLPVSTLALPFKLENRYALLLDDDDDDEDDDEKESCLYLNHQDKGYTTSTNTISDPVDETDYEVFRNIYGNLCIKKTCKSEKIKSSVADQKSSGTADDTKMIMSSSIADQKSSSAAAGGTKMMIPSSSSVADQTSSTTAAAADVDDTKKTRLALYKKKKWINSWCKKGNNDKKTLSIYVDSYFRKNRKAGYGVIIRYHSGFPLVASVGVHDQGKPVSALYLELQGINRGLNLAIKYEIQNVNVRTNSFAAALLVRTSLIMFHWDCMCGSTFGTCKRCAWHHRSPLNLIVDKNSRIAGVYPLLQEIVGKCVMLEQRHSRDFIISIRRKMNKAADYLAKLHERKEEMSPQEFPEQLKDILYEDAWVCKSKYWKIPKCFCDFNSRMDFVTGNRCPCFSCRQEIDYSEVHT